MAQAKADPAIDPDPVNNDDGPDWSYRLGQILAWPVLLGAAAGIVFIVVGLFQGGKIDPGSDPSFIDTIFASRTIVGAARVVLLIGGMYMVASIVVLISRNQWLSKVGPIEVSESTAGIAEERDALATELQDAREQIDALEEHLEATSNAYAETVDLLRVALEQIDNLAEGKEDLE